MKHGQVKGHIVETASNLFYKKGFNSTGINEIIAKAGIAKATLYNHFKSKEDLCVAYLQHKNSNFLLEIEAFCNSKKKGKAQVLAVFDFLLKFFKSKEFHGCWCIKTVAEIPMDNNKIKNEIQTQKLHFINFIFEVISKNIESKKAKERKQLGRQIYVLYEGAVAESYLHQSIWPITESKKVASILLN